MLDGKKNGSAGSPENLHTVMRSMAMAAADDADFE